MDNGIIIAAAILLHWACFSRLKDEIPLKIRPAGLSPGFYKGSADYGASSGEWCIGRIYEVHGGTALTREGGVVTSINSGS